MQMTHYKFARKAAPLTAAGLALAAILSGCGGPSNSTGILPTATATPAVEGIDPGAEIQLGDVYEDSGFATTDAKTGYLTGAVASTAKPLAPIANTFNGTIPLGFSPGGTFATTGGPTGAAVSASASVIFGATIANGTSGSSPSAIVPSSVILTSPEVSGFSQALKFTFTNNQTGPLANAQYTTGAFTLPFNTPGLHTVRVAVSDQAGASSTTDFEVVVVNSTTVALYASNITPDATITADNKTGTAQAINPGDTATITGAVEGAKAQTTADSNGIVILFAAPGKQTFSVTDAGKTVTQTVDLSKAAGTAVIQ